MSASPRPSHAARLESSPRLRTLLSALLKAGERGLTTREIFDRTGSMAVHSDCHELRENGYRIECRPDPVPAAAGAGRERRGPGVASAGGRRRFRYRLLGRLAEHDESPVPSTGPGPDHSQTEYENERVR